MILGFFNYSIKIFKKNNGQKSSNKLVSNTFSICEKLQEYYSDNIFNLENISVVYDPSVKNNVLQSTKQTSIYKILDWAVTNSYEIMDLEYGYLEYKRRWSNYIYEFNHHVIYSKNNIKATLLASVEILKLKLKNLLKSLNIDKLVKNLKGYFYKQKTTHIAIAYKTESIDFINTNNLETLNINSPQLINLKKIIFDFLFVNKTHISDLKIYEIAPLKEYVFCGKTKSQKIIIT